MHTVIFNNASIAVKILADIDAINYYGAEYDVMEPSDSLAIKSFADYMAGCVKA